MLWTPLILRRYLTIVCFFWLWSCPARLFWLQLQLVASRCSTFAPERLIGIFSWDVELSYKQAQPSEIAAQHSCVTAISCTYWLWPWIGKSNKIETHPCPPQRCTTLDKLLHQNLPASCLAWWQFPTRTPLGLCSRWFRCSPLCCASYCVWMGTHSTRRQHATWKLHQRIWFAFTNTLLRCVAPATCAHNAVFFDLQARATSEIAVADLSDSENR